MQEKDLFNSQNACTEYEQCLCGTRTMLVNRIHITCHRKENTFFLPPKTSLQRKKTGFHSISNVNISLSH